MSSADIHQLRNTLIEKRKHLSDEKQKSASHQIFISAKQLSSFKTAQTIAFYLSVQGEVNCTELIDAAFQTEKSVFLPALDQTTQLIQFVKYREHDPLVKNDYGFLEPIITPEKTIRTRDIDLAFIPLVAFDLQKNRLGRGKGHYDRTFAFTKMPHEKTTTLVGLSYEFQCTPQLNTQDWDVPLDTVVTEKKIR